MQFSLHEHCLFSGAPVLLFSAGACLLSVRRASASVAFSTFEETRPCLVRGRCLVALTICGGGVVPGGFFIQVDTPLDVEARVRFQKYRGLKSFRTSYWNKDEDLPVAYARVVDFERYKVRRAETSYLTRSRWRTGGNISDGG